MDERTVLCRVLARRGIQLQSASPELSNINAIICASCCRLLVRIQSAEQELKMSLSLVDSFLALANHSSVSQPQTCNVSAHNQLTQHQETVSMEMGQDSNQCPTTSTIVSSDFGVFNVLLAGIKFSLCDTLVLLLNRTTFLSRTRLRWKWILTLVMLIILPTSLLLAQLPHQ